MRVADHITHERNRLFGPKTCIMGDPCYFRTSDREAYAHGKVVGATVIKRYFDVRDVDGVLHKNIKDVRLDHENVRGVQS